MDQLEQLKQLMDGFKESQRTLQKQMAEFQNLQHEIAQLQARTHRDPDAQAKLTRLGQAMSGDYQQQRAALLAKVSQAETYFELLEQQFKQFSGREGEGDAEPSSVSLAEKKLRRLFV